MVLAPLTWQRLLLRLPLEPSHVLLGMGYSRDRARSSLRFSLSRYTTHADIDHTLQVLEGLLSQK